MSTPNPPPRVIMAGWFSIVAGLGKLIGLPIFLLSIREQATLLTSGPPPPLFPLWLARMAGFVIDHLHAFVAGWMLIGALMTVAGGYLLGRRRWARTLLEILCWFGAVEAPAVAAFVYSVQSMLLRLDLPETDALASTLVSRFWTSLGWLGVYLVLLLLLKGRQVGAWVGGRTIPRQEG